MLIRLVLVAALVLIYMRSSRLEVRRRPRPPTKLLPEKIAESVVAIDVDSGRRFSLREMAQRSEGGVGEPSEMRAVWLSDLEGEALESLVVHRLRDEPDREIFVMGDDVYSLDEVIEEVVERSELGQDFVLAQKVYIADLKAKFESGQFAIPRVPQRQLTSITS